MSSAITIHSKADFEGMQRAGQLAASILDRITPFVKVGVSTEELDALCVQMIKEAGAISACLNYVGSAMGTPYPKSICTSINNVICHGIPSTKRLIEGDIMNIDITVILDGYHGDTSRMYFAGKKIPIQAKRVTNVAYECMMLGIQKVRPGAKFNEIGLAIEAHAKQHGYSVVRDFCGHGIGKTFHAPPQILHYYDQSMNEEMKEGMFFTIEPMINVGSYESKILQDGWTAVTKDRSLSAQFEHTVAVTKDGYHLFTASPAGYTVPPYS